VTICRSQVGRSICSGSERDNVPAGRPEALPVLRIRRDLQERKYDYGCEDLSAGGTQQKRSGPEEISSRPAVIVLAQGVHAFNYARRELSP
jgi:hypothetical protein